MMKNALRFKLLLYRFLTTEFGNLILKSLSNFVTVKDLGNKTKLNKCKFLVVITVDTESGFVDKNERRTWQKENPEAFVGYYYGIRNLLEMLEKHEIKATFFLSTQCFSSKSFEYKKIMEGLNNLLNNKHEIGLHLHPDSDFSIQKRLRKKFNATSAFFYSYDEKVEIISAAKDLVKRHLGEKAAKNITSFRWGNWALDTGGARALNKLGFTIDSSATPGIKGHMSDGMKYDWSGIKHHYPWKLSTRDYRAIHHANSNVTEIPIATFDLFGIKLRADPVNSLLLQKAFSGYYKMADRSQIPFPFVVITHSSEATTKDGRPTRALKDLDDFISNAIKFDDVEFVTLNEAYRRLNFKKQ